MICSYHSFVLSSLRSFVAQDVIQELLPDKVLYLWINLLNSLNLQSSE